MNKTQTVQCPHRTGYMNKRLKCFIKIGVQYHTLVNPGLAYVISESGPVLRRYQMLGKILSANFNRTYNISFGCSSFELLKTGICKQPNITTFVSDKCCSIHEETK